LADQHLAVAGEGHDARCGFGALQVEVEDDRRLGTLQDGDDRVDTWPGVLRADPGL
jgi:hypothetical protein